MPAAILDGRALAARLFGETGGDPRAYLVGFGYAPPPLDRVAEGAEPLLARVNRGIWIASCPCGATGLPAPGGVVWLDCPLIWCPRCGNAAVGGAWRPAVVPEHRAAIEAVLALRPDPETLNWEPDESIANLVSENREHGDPVPRDEVA